MQSLTQKNLFLSGHKKKSLKSVALSWKLYGDLKSLSSLEPWYLSHKMAKIIILRANT